MTNQLSTGYVACNASQGDMLDEVDHGEIRATEDEACVDVSDDLPSVRYVAADGYLYVERPE